MGRRAFQIEGNGQQRSRWGIIEIVPATATSPVLLEKKRFGDGRGGEWAIGLER